MSTDFYESVTQELQRLAAQAEPSVHATPSVASHVLRRARRAQFRMRFAMGASGVLVIGTLAAGSLVGHSRYFDFVQPSEAMTPTISVGEIVTIDKALTPQVGDVVLAKVVSNGQTITALFRYAGDATHPVSRELLFVPNHGPMNYASISSDSTSITPLAGRAALLGDNRALALDSRFFGFIDASNIEGVAIRVRQPGGKEHDIASAPTHESAGSAAVDPPAEVPTTSSVSP